ncbi:MAG TPA: DUF3857 domain-containing protein, partial [Candidatus Limnocylindrales bacterium]|nr:DUF3857 domain-containing protein [Candidatus Limnocylindrales bacterium]
MNRPYGKLWPALLLLTAVTPSSAAETPPPWLAEAVSMQVPTYDPRVPAVVLHDEERLVVDKRGHVQGIRRFAVRILRYEGRASAVADCPYRTDAGGVRDVKAWLVQPSGKTIVFGRKNAIDVAAAGNDVYNEARVVRIDGSSDADAGSVFGFEASFENLSPATQFIRDFQDELPTLRSRFELEVPAGWKVRGMMFNHERVEPAVVGQATAWELRDLPWIEDEPLRPPTTSLAPRLAVGGFPPDGAPRPEAISFDSWDQVARWLEDLSTPSSAPNPAITAKAQALAGTGLPPLDRVRAIGRYVQELNYIAIQMGLSRGGGYRPHPASDVFARSYGDCKDKANLMKTMLACVGIESYLVAIRSGDPDYVRDAWPSPYLFDHCIVAIRTAADSLPARVTDPRLGQFLLFDPTDPETPLGDLPSSEQGGWALLESRDGGALVRAPMSSPEANRVERRLEVELDSSGSVRAAFHERASGSMATLERRTFHGLSEHDYRQAVERWVALAAPHATVSKVSTRDDEPRNRFDLDVDFGAAPYAQLTGDRLMLYQPAIVSRHDALQFTSPTRRHPVLFQPWMFRETAETTLPAGFE